MPYTEEEKRKFYKDLDWEKKFDEEFVDRISGDMWQVTSREAIKSFIAQTHKDLVEAIIGDVERSKNWDKVEPNFDLPNYLRAKYLNKKLNV